jgi:hypothetical protein
MKGQWIIFLVTVQRHYQTTLIYLLLPPLTLAVQRLSRGHIQEALP